MIICHPDPPPNAQLILHSLLAVFGELIHQIVETNLIYRTHWHNPFPVFHKSQSQTTG